MPGILAFVGADPETIRRATRALARRPWHEVRVVDDPSSNVTIGAVAEHGGVCRDPSTGVLAAVDGEFVDGGLSTGEPAAAELLRRYLGDGAELQPPEGWFTATVWDPRTQTLSLITDRLGQRPLYVARSGRRILAAGELKALVAADIAARLDLVAWAELLAYEFALGDRTPLEGVRAVPAAATLEIPLESAERLHRRWRYRIEPAETGDERELAEELAVLVRAAVSARVDDDAVLALSGGLDSRAMLASLIGGPRVPLLVSYGAPGSEDLQLGQTVASRVGFPHRSLPLEPGYLARGAAETVWLGEGSVRCLHTHHLTLRRLRDEGLGRAILIGLAGDPVFRAYAGVPRASDGRFPESFHRNLATCVRDTLLDAVLTPSFADQLRGLARDSLAERLEEEQGEPVNRVRQFIFNQSQRRKVAPGALLFGDDLSPRDPFADGALIEFCRRMPERLRQGGLLQRTYLSRFGKLAELPSPKDGLPPALSGRRRQFSVRVVKARRRARAELEERFGFRWLPDRRGLGGYAHELRTHGRALLDLLLEPRTLARGQLCEDGVRKLVDELLAGRRRNTRPLGMLMTLELFQRQFVDGELRSDAEASYEEVERVGA